MSPGQWVLVGLGAASLVASGVMAWALCAIAKQSDRHLHAERARMRVPASAEVVEHAEKVAAAQRRGPDPDTWRST